MYEQLKDEEPTADETEVKETPGGNDQESVRLSDAASPKSSYGTTPLAVEDETLEVSPCCDSYIPWCGTILYVMIFFGIFCAFALRAALSQAIVAMVNETDVSNATSECPRDEDELADQEGELDWTREQQSVVLAAFYYGHMFALVCSLTMRYDT